jgi:chemotaxis response regulator CheB
LAFKGATIMEKSKHFGVLLADDSAIIRKAVTRLLESEPAIKLLAEAETFSQTIQLATALKPDVVLLDLHMPDDHAFEPEFVKSQLALAGSRILATSFSKPNADDSRTLAERLGAVTLLDKLEFGSVLIPTILRVGASPSNPA